MVTPVSTEEPSERATDAYVSETDPFIVSLTKISQENKRAQIAARLPKTQVAYITYLIRESDAPGAYCLQRSLRRVASRHPLIVMHTHNISQEVVDGLLEEGCYTWLVPPFCLPGHQHLTECWTKLCMWQLDDYERLIYLAADCVLRKNIDLLFAMPQGFYAVGDCISGRQPSLQRHLCPFAQDPANPPYFNAGFFVFHPDKQLLEDCNHLLTSNLIRAGGCAEQDFLNGYYKDFKPLPPMFNAQRGIKHHHPNLWNLQHAHVINYTGLRPWDHDQSQDSGFQDLIEIWWEVYEGRSGELNIDAACSTSDGAEASGGLEAFDAPRLLCDSELLKVGMGQGMGAMGAVPAPMPAGLAV